MCWAVLDKGQDQGCCARCSAAGSGREMTDKVTMQVLGQGGSVLEERTQETTRNSACLFALHLATLDSSRCKNLPCRSGPDLPLMGIICV